MTLPAISHASRDVASLANSQTRRHFLQSSSLNLGAAALAGLVGGTAVAGPAAGNARNAIGGIPDVRSLVAKARRVIYLFQSGGPSQVDLLDYKPHLKELIGQDLPPSARMGQRLTGFTKDQATLPVVPSKFTFQRCGESGTWISEVLPYTQQVADDICVINSITSEAINHDPARMFLQTGSQLAGRPSLGSWISYGLGSECRDLPSFMVLTSHGSAKRQAQPISIRLWGNAFLPSQHQGVKLMSTGDPILYVSNPAGLDRTMQGRSIEAVARLNRMQEEVYGDPEIDARIRQYEMAFKMQASVPDLVDLSDESDHTFELYGKDSRTRGTYAANCLLARRLAERGVRFIQLYHVDWDHHEDIPRDCALQCGDIDQATAALITDLKQRGMFDDTLIIWGGEFGRTIYSQGPYTADRYGRDHHGRCFSMWLAGGGVKPGITYGASDDFSYSVAENPVHVHDLQATILHLMGIDHTRLTYRFQGRDFRLTDVHGHVVRDILT